MRARCAGGVRPSSLRTLTFLEPANGSQGPGPWCCAGLGRSSGRSRHLRCTHDAQMRARRPSPGGEGGGGGGKIVACDGARRSSGTGSGGTARRTCLGRPTMSGATARGTGVRCTLTTGWASHSGTLGRSQDARSAGMSATSLPGASGARRRVRRQSCLARVCRDAAERRTRPAPIRRRSRGGAYGRPRRAAAGRAGRREQDAGARRARCGTQW